MSKNRRRSPGVVPQPAPSSGSTTTKTAEGPSPQLPMVTSDETTSTDHVGVDTTVTTSGPSSNGSTTVAVPDSATPVATSKFGGFGGFLVQRGLITDERLELVIARQNTSGQSLVQTILSERAIDENDLASAIAAFANLTVVNLRRDNVESKALEYVSEAIARQYLLISYRRDRDGLHVAVVEPNEQVRAELANQTQLPVHFSVAPLSDVIWAIDSNYRAIAGVDRLIQAFEGSGAARRRDVEVNEVDITTDDAPIVQLVNQILTQAKRDRASDVHVEPVDDRVRIRFRIDGALLEVLELPGSMAAGIVSRIKVMAGMNIVERRRPQDGQFAITIDGKDIDVRVATISTIMGEVCAMRILDKTRAVFHLSDLGMPADTGEIYSKLVRAPFGMVLCAGPTGSGKTTTLYATLSEISNSELNFMTIEDPVEYVYPTINQIQANEQAGLTFATGLRSILRQDPDVILVGEIRDVETTRVAVQSALTGHFVLSSLHATDSVSALHRLLDMGIESFLVASSVLAVVGQRLLRRICPSCKSEYQLTDEEKIFYQESGGTPKDVFYRGTGCNFCSGTGYKERIGVYELLVITPEIRRMVVGWATQEELRAQAVKQGMRTLRQEAINLVAQDMTSVEEVMRSLYTL